MVLNWSLIKFYQVKGFFRMKKLKKNSTYFGGVNKTYGVYMGDGMFYETKQYDCGMGIQYVDSKPRKYNYLQLGLFDWTICGELKTEID